MGLPIALETNGTVLDALGFASRMYTLEFSLSKRLTANCKLINPITLSLLAINFVHSFTTFLVSSDNEIDGRQHAESPECTVSYTHLTLPTR